jgi:adenylate cyclase
MRFCGHCGAPAVTAAAQAPPIAPRPADPLAGGEERRLVTAVFADLAGFTALAQQLDAEDLLEIVDPILSELGQVVTAFEGRVEKFAGDALLALFGVPVSHEDDVDRALQAALEMHRRVARVVAALPGRTPLSLHIGINTGHGVGRIVGSEGFSDYAVLGDSVILAQRLESAAPAGQTYVGEATQRLARGRFTLEPVQDLSVKGVAEPVAAWRLIDRADGRAMAPHAGAAIGRAEEMDVLVTALAALAGGQGGVVVLAGEAGVGKSHLAGALADRATDAGVGVFSARCLSYGAVVPYWPVQEIVRSVAGALADDDTEVVAGRLQGLAGPRDHDAVTQLLGTAAGEELAAKAFPRALSRAVEHILRAAASRAPVMVLLEDAHWIDAASRSLLDEVLRALAGDPVLFLLTGRPDPVLDALAAAAANPSRVDLSPLPADALAALIGGLLDGPVAAAVSDEITMRSGGNPFFAQELVRAWREDGSLIRRGGGWVRDAAATSAVPATVEGLLAARIDRLPVNLSEALKTAAVIGREVPVGLLQAVSAAASDEALAALVSHELLVRSPDGVSFRHALVQEVAYGRLLRRQRRAVHRAVAEQAERLSGSGDDVISLLARHWYLADAGAQAVPYLERAGLRARSLYANAEAVEHLSRAVEILRTADDPRRHDVLLELADIYGLVGDYDRAAAAYAQVRDATGSTRAWAGVVATARRQGAYEAALVAADAALVTHGVDAAVLQLERGWTLTAAGRFADAMDALSAGLRNHPGDALAGQLLLQLAVAADNAGDAAGAAGHLDAALELLGDAPEAEHARALRIAGPIYAQMGRSEEAVAALEEGLTLADRAGSAEDIGACLVNLGLVELERGNVTAAVAANRRAVEEFERIAHAGGTALAFNNLADSLLQSGALDEAARWCDKALLLADRIGDDPTAGEALVNLAQVLLAQGDPGGAAQRATQAAGRFDAADLHEDAATARALAERCAAGAG